MPKAIDLTGKVFNRLTVIRFIESRPTPWGSRHRIYEVRCECGTVREAIGTALVYGSLKSCGCLKVEVQKTGSITHGHARHGAWSPEYRTWQSMLRRCLTPSASNYWEQIHAAHPLESNRHDLYAEAMRLVGAKRSKGALVELVTWLLLRAERGGHPISPVRSSE